MEFFLQALKAIPAVASSPFALVAYVILVLCWAFVAWKVKRNKNLLSALENLPEKDRLRALELEMGAVRIKSGLTPDQWLRSQTNRFLLIGFIAICLTLVLIVALSVGSTVRHLTPEVSLTIADDFRVVGVDAIDEVHYENLRYETGYSYEKRGDKMYVKPAGYFGHLRGGAIVPEVNLEREDIKNPALSYKVANNTDQVLLLSEVVLDVHSSEIDNAPVLLVNGNRYGELEFGNMGWGEVLNPKLSISVIPGYVCSGEYYQMDDIENTPLKTDIELDKYPVILDIENFVKGYADTTPECSKKIYRVCDWRNCEYIESKKIQCLDNEYYERCEKVDRKLDEQALKIIFPEGNLERLSKNVSYERSCRYFSICIFGNLSYGHSGNMNGQFKFYADVSFEPRPRPRDYGPGDPTPPSRIYHAYLEAGKSGYADRFPVSHTIRPGESDHFIVKLMSNRSAEFDLTMSVLSAGGEEVHQQHINLFMFVPSLLSPADFFPLGPKNNKSSNLGKNLGDFGSALKY